jgi:hypothetical protein
MRVAVKLKVSAYTLDGVLTSARDSWRKFSGDSSAELPAGAEIDIEQETTVNKDYVYNATVFVRTKIEEDGK